MRSFLEDGVTSIIDHFSKSDAAGFSQLSHNQVVHGDVQLVSLNMLCKDRDMSITHRALFLSSEKILSEPSARQDVLTAAGPILEGKVNDIITQVSHCASLALIPIYLKKPALRKPTKHSCRQFPKAGCSRNIGDRLNDHVKRILPHPVISVTDNEVDPSVNGEDIVVTLATVQKVGPVAAD